MDDIRLFETDGDYLVLEAQDGQKYRLLVDDSVRSSVRKESLPQLDTITITPREIQDEVRNGATIEELMQRSGAPFDYIEKFAAPVIDELSHIVALALSIRLTIAGDRYSDANQIEFGEIIGNRLVTSGATGITWKAQRADLGTWNVTAFYRLNDVEGSATWSFDPRRLALSPESETAVTLSSQETLNDGPIPKLRTVIAPTISPNKPIEVAETQTLDDVIPIGRGAADETPIAVAPPVAPVVASTPAAFANREAKPVDTATEEPLSATADLLDALRRKRSERDELKLEAHPETGSVRVIDLPPVTSLEIVVEETAPSSLVIEEALNEGALNEAHENDVSANEHKPASNKKGRAAMPSWDEIVFGTKADD